MIMSLNQILPFISTAVMAWFTVDVFQRFIVRRNPAFLFWGIGLAMFGAGSFAEAYLALAWNKWVFFVWYLFGIERRLAGAWNAVSFGTQELAARCNCDTGGRKFVRDLSHVTSHSQTGYIRFHNRQTDQ
jgi:hypothetical protein